MDTWKINLIAVWLGCFFTGMAISQILPFLPLYIEQLGVHNDKALTVWSGVTFSVTFLISAFVSPLWGAVADRRGRKLMLLRAALGMSIVILLQAFIQHPWQLLILRAVMGLTSGFTPNAMALIASEAPATRSGWALSIVSTGQVSGVLLGPLIGGLLADSVGLRTVFILNACLLLICFVITLFMVREPSKASESKKIYTGDAQSGIARYSWAIVVLFFTTLLVQMINGSVSPVLTLFVRELSPDTHNLAFLSGFITSVAGLSALISAPILGKTGDRIGAEKTLTASLIFIFFLFVGMYYVTDISQFTFLRFMTGFADGAMFPAVQSLLLKLSDKNSTGKIFGYNQSFMYLGNVFGPLFGAGVSAVAGYRWVFMSTAFLAVINIMLLVWVWKKLKIR
ncbi:MFS transporter [Pantoea stewartii]|uniref:Multidrug transporter n=1 Tax=Pantoea stewartii TaxID=66269 RepID=A0AB34VEH7_9GAMM|nr:MFS transporter [Pantoea stewartii]KTS73517.1 multidrug transporter [Pantoea stewartii]KTS96683.1 multidrug transporter [Pantoea stewartii]KTT06180.1 multidrug transporter [Pantoea stewartii]